MSKAIDRQDADPNQKLTAIGLNPNDVWIIVPAYNEAQRITATLRNLVGSYSNIVLVDDGSSDATSITALSVAGVSVVRHAINCGQGAALQTGIDFALRRNAKYIVTFDGDGQHRQEDIPHLLAPLLSDETDVALGSRFLGDTVGMPWSRYVVLKLGVAFTRWFSWIRVTDTHNGLRAFNRVAAEKLHITLNRMAHASEILDQIRVHRLRYCEVPVTIRYSEATLAKGQSSWNSVRIVGQLLLQRIVR